MIEFSENIQITNEEWDDELFQEILLIGTLIIIYTNDLLSFRKELIECNGDFKNCRNLLSSFCSIENLSLQESSERLVKMIVDGEEHFKNLHKKIYERNPPISKNLRLFVRKSGYLVGGNWLGCIGINRYTGKDCSKAELVMGHFKYSKNFNIYESNNEVEKFGQYFPHD